MKKLFLLASLLASSTLTAQQPADPATLKFDVASVKPNKSGQGFMTVSMQPSQFTMINVPARQLILRAYQVQPYQILGGPSWTTSDRFDLTAKAGDNTTPAQISMMVQTLLADRFKLKVHKETRQSDIYRLVKARPDGKLGENLKPAAVDCGAGGRGRPGGPGPGAAVPPPGGVARFGGPQPGPGGPVGGCMFMMGPGRFEVSGQPLGALASTLAGQLARPVIDETGLTGNYDYTLTFMPDAGGGRGIPPPGAPDFPPVDPNAPALTTALIEQLGLKLEPAKGPVEMIVIDSIEQPTED